MKDDRPPEGGQARSDSEREGTEALSRAPTVSGPPASVRPELRPVSSSLTPGQSFGPYQIHRLLGKGGMGEVYEAEDTETGRRVALKVLSQTLIEPADRARFLREGRLAASISHRNSVYVYGTAEIDGVPVISMEFVPSGTLKDRVLEKGPMPVSEAVDAILQVIDGLEAASSVGVLHRDIKPSNCFLDQDGTVKVGDFGLSISTLSRAESHLTATGTFMGTPSFASPEQVRCEELDVRSDIYSVGATLYYLLTGRAPFEEERMGKLIAAVLERAPEPLRRLRPDVPRGLERVIIRCLEKDPGARFTTYAALRGELQPYSSIAPRPATLGLRFVGGMVDSLLFALGYITFTLYRGGVDAFGNPSVSLGLELFDQAWKLLYFTVAEGLWGASLGKAICGLRVVGPTRSAPGLQRAFLRAFVWLSVPDLPTFTYLVAHSGEKFSSKDTAVRLLCSSALTILLFATARRANGFAGLHDLASRTRVILRRAPISRPILQTPMEVVPDSQRRTRFGPYWLLATLSERPTGRLLLGYDDQLRRNVWILTVPPGSSAIAAGRRDISRSARIRWLNGRRTATECWDAYEAPEGRALLDLAADRMPWDSIRHWLLEVGEELIASMKDESLPPMLGLENLWVTRDGRVKLLDFPAPVERAHDLSSTRVMVTRGDLSSVQQFLRALAIEALGQPSTIHARAILDDLDRETFQTPESLIAGLRSLFEKPPSLPRWRRAGHLAACAAIPLVSCVLLAIVRARMHGPSTETGIMWFRNSVIRLGALQSPDPSCRSCAQEREDIEIYLASRYRSKIGDPVFRKEALRSSVLMNEELLKLAERAVVRHPNPSKNDAARARRAVEGEGPTRLQTLNFLVSGAGGTFVVIGLLGVLSAAFFRGGFLLNGIGMIVVGADGREASRLRSTWRALVAWSPWLIVPFAVEAVLTAGHPRFFTTFRLRSLVFWQGYPLWIAMAIFLIGAVCAVVTPERGLQDRIAGTYLLPR